MGILTGDELDCRLDFEDVKNYGLLGLGTAGAIVIAEDTDIRQVLLNAARFFAHESCGQCTQCREGTAWIYKMASRIAAGAGRVADLDLILEQTHAMGMMPGLSICGLPDGAAYAVRTIIEKFRAEFEQRIAEQEPGQVERVARALNPAVYERPLYGRRPPKAMQAQQV